MKKFFKHSLALLCCLCMLMALVPTVSAASTKKILFLGSDAANDTAYYLAELAHLTGTDIEVAVLEQQNGTLRKIASAADSDKALTYSRANAATEYKLRAVSENSGKTTVKNAVKEQAWDVIVLQQGVMYAGIETSYREDLNYMVDLVEDLAPNAKLYWNMTWGVEDGNQYAVFTSSFGGNTATFYNAIVNTVKSTIASDKSFDGIIYTGAAIQNARATALGEKMLRNQMNLTYKQGRLIAAMTALKTLTGANLGKITVSALESILTGSGDTYENNDANLKLVKEAATAACSGAPKLLADDAKPITNEHEGIITVGQTTFPNFLHFPDVTVDDNGTVYVSAYEFMAHSPDTESPSEGNGRLVFYKSTDNGKTFQQMPFVIDDAQMEKWGLVKLSDRYARLKADPSLDYTYYFDPRDPNIKSLHVDVNGDGKKENILFLTFWVRSFKKSGSTSSGTTYCTYSTDGGKTWTTPQGFLVSVKRGDVTEFADGTILMPTYSSGDVVATYLTIDQNGIIHNENASVIKDGAWDGTEGVGAEASFIAPNGGDTVYTNIRESGAILRSDDRGKTWTLIANIEGAAQQPGFTQIDENRVFATWTNASLPRWTYGKVFYLDGSWDDSGFKICYGEEQSVAGRRDSGDPSCATLKDGNVITVAYDTYYRSIIATIQDPDDPAYARTSVTPQVSAVPATGTAYTSKQTVDLDGTPTTFDMYMLVDENGGETNYIKLRDIAYLLNGTAAQFEVNFFNGIINLLTDKAYTANGSEMSTPFSGARTFKACNTTIRVNGSVPALTGITLTDDAGGEYNYFKLRDLGTALGFKVDYNAATNSISVATK